MEKDKNIFQIKSYEDGDMKNSIRVAFASNTAEKLDGHFGSCERFLIYQLSAKERCLIDVRNASDSEKNSYRASLLKDCQILFVISIGGPAAAKVVKEGVHPVKSPQICSTKKYLENLQRVINKAPPPWLAKIMGHDQQSRVRFKQSAADV